MKKVIVIVGPTASGKTKRSIELAKKINGEIINGDSVQIFKELNIGSAKIKEEEKENINHHLLDIRNVGESYSAYNFQIDVRNLINKIEVPIIVGGTGFYIKSALYNYQFNKEENSEQFANLSNEELYLKLLEKDPNIIIDKNNRIRLVRALNLAIDGNKRSEKTGKDQPLYKILAIYLDYPRSELKEVLTKRLKLMINNGFIEEVKALKESGHNLNIIGYREIYKYLNNEISLDEAFNEIIRSSMKLAKKQKTWFKNQMDINFIDAKSANIDCDIYNKVIEFLGE